MKLLLAAVAHVILSVALMGQVKSETPIEVSLAVAPIYPPLALSANVTGDVEVRVTVNEAGAAVSAETINGREPLKHSALEAARRWKFQPQQHNAEAVLTFSFVIVPDRTLAEDATPIFSPPYRVEVRRKLPEPTVNYHR